jgi:prepilin-type N-terminal cleavage/methylation domain-containing protein
MIKRILNKKGFTLVESVIAISIIGVIGIIMADILGRTFDNNEKTNLVSNVQQNGQAALSTIDDVIRNSQFVCLGGSNPSGVVLNPNQVNIEYQNPILVVFRDGRFIRYRIVTQTTTDNGYIIEDYPTTSVLDLNSSFCKTDSTNPPFIPFTNATGQRIITNRTALSVKRGGVTLLSNPVTGFSSRGTSNVAVTILFSIGPTRTAPINPENQIGENNEIEFKTTTQFR